MATEKRLDLIDRKDLIKAVETKHFTIADNTHPYKAIRIQGKYFREVVENAPTVDAVEVVRCKDCKFLHDKGYCTKTSGLTRNKPDDFCSYGEKENRWMKNKKNDTKIFVS